MTPRAVRLAVAASVLALAAAVYVIAYGMAAGHCEDDR